MNDVFSDDQRDFESRLFHGNFLHLIDIFQFPHIEKSAHSSVLQSLDDLWGQCFVSIRNLLQLSYFFFESHDGEILLDGNLNVFFCLDLLNKELKLLEINSFAFQFIHLLFGWSDSHVSTLEI